VRWVLLDGAPEAQQALERLGGEVLALAADLGDPASVAAALAAAQHRFGSVDGVLHLAAEPERKVEGALALATALTDQPLDFFVLSSSLEAVFPEREHVERTAADAFSFALATALAQRGVPAVAIGWDPEAGVQGIEAFERIVASGLPQILVSTVPLDLRREQHGRRPLAEMEHPEGTPTAASPGADHPRPALATPYVEPRAELEQQIAAVWQEVLGIDRVGLHDNFFELGGNSLAGLRVVGRIKERMQASLSEVSLYEAPTVATLARLITAERQEEPVAAPTYEVSRSRGERRKARQLQKRES
jgi:acyl carrier protein